MLFSPQEEACFCCGNLGKFSQERKKRSKNLPALSEILSGNHQKQTSTHAMIKSGGNGPRNQEHDGKMLPVTVTHACHIRRRCDEPQWGRGNFPYLVLPLWRNPSQPLWPKSTKPTFLKSPFWKEGDGSLTQPGGPGVRCLFPRLRELSLTPRATAGTYKAGCLQQLQTQRHFSYGDASQLN